MAITLAEHTGEFRKALVGTFIGKTIVRLGLEGLFPRHTYNAEMLSIAVQRNRQLVAVDVQRCTDPIKNTFSRATEKLFLPPYYKESFDFCKCDGYKTSYGAGEIPNGSTARNIARGALNELEAIRAKVERAIEIQRSQVLESGIVILKNGDSIDYKRKAASIKVATTPWTNHANSNPYQDIIDGMNFLRDEGQSTGSSINAIFGSAALTNFLSNEKVLKELDIRRIERINIVMPQFDNVTGMAFHGQFGAGDFVINIWTYNEQYLDPADNTTRKKYIGTNNVILVPEDFVGETSFATTPMVGGNSESGYYVRNVEGQYTVYDIIDQVKAAWEVILQSSPLVVPVTIDRIYTLKTV